MINSKIVAKLKYLETQRKTADQIWDLIRRFVMPMRSDFFKDTRSEHSVEWRQNRLIFDSTAGDGLETLSSSLHGSLTSPAIQWFELAFRDTEMNKDKDAMVWLENAARDTYNALQDSNFNLEANETYIDLVGYGSSVIVEEEDPDDEGEVLFKSIPLQEAYFEEGHKGQVVNLYRKLKWTPMQIVDKFGNAVPKKIKEAAEDVAQAERKFDVIFCVFERKEKKGNLDAAGILAPLERPFGMKWVMYEGGELLGEEGGYYEMPAFVPRWRKAEGSQWGFGPSHLALPDILTANQLVEMTLRSVEKVIDPAILTTERGLISDVDLGPGGLTVLRDIEAMKPFESRARFDAGEVQLDKLQSAIRRTYYVDQLEMKDSPAMTATEVQVRYELMQRLLGPTLGRLENDFLNPLIQRTFNIRYRAGKFGPPPQAVLDSAGRMDVVYTGPLARAQKVDQATNIERWAGMTANLAEVAPEVIDVPDWDEMTREQGKLLGVPTKFMNSAAQVTKKRTDREKQQAAAMQAEMDSTQSATDKTNAEAGAIEDGAQQ
jgi:hypothetical protein